VRIIPLYDPGSIFPNHLDKQLLGGFGGLFVGIKVSVFAVKNDSLSPSSSIAGRLRKC
jgi:hypothetical protein